MGQQQSRTPRRLSLSRTLSIKDRNSHKYHKTKAKTLSATFNILDKDLNWDLLNVNLATEEELMTLPGVNRSLAHCIVLYRQTIGGFKKVEDLALVSGVGASTLEFFRSEITVNSKRKNGESKSPSENESIDSLPISENGSFRQYPGKVININSANVFQLMTVRGIGQELAANIMDYRERKGQFHTVNDLLKVKTMTPGKFAAIRTNLSAEMLKPSKTKMCNMFNNSVLNNVESQAKHRRTKSAPINHVPPQPLDILFQEVFSILSRHSHRPIIEDVFRNNRKGQAAMRIASWNLEQFSDEKSKNPGVQEVVCRTILENGLSLLAVHEVYSPEALNSIVCELNNPVLPKTSSWGEKGGQWHFWLPSDIQGNESQQVFSGFLYNSHHGLQIKDSCVLKEPEGNVQISQFQMEKFQFLLASSYLANASNSFVHSLVKSVNEKFPGTSSMIIFENSRQNNSLKGFNPTELSGFKEIIPYGMATLASSRTQCTRIWISNTLEEQFTGHWGVVRDGLYHLAIPKGWTWGGTVSDHFPIWLELFSENRTVSSLSTSVSTETHQLQNGNPKLPAHE